MELEFLKMIDFSLVVSDEELARIAETILLFNQPESALSSSAT